MATITITIDTETITDARLAVRRFMKAIETDLRNGNFIAGVDEEAKIDRFQQLTLAYMDLIDAGHQAYEAEMNGFVF